MGYPNSISMRPFGVYPKSKTVRAFPKADSIILMWSLGVYHRSPTVPITKCIQIFLGKYKTFTIRNYLKAHLHFPLATQ